MAYRNVFISSSAKLSVKNNQLIVNLQEEYTIPLEDINAILIESTQVNITSALLSKCSQSGVLVYLCDDKHLPCGVLTGYNCHSRKFKILQAQINIKAPLQKNIWQSLVVQKIVNQSEVLKLNNKNEFSEIYSISKKVKSNDEDNMEAVAASKYFKYLFGSKFSRGQENIINARLNYGYAIVRGLICRSLVVYGLEPSLGVHHQSQLNAFNLADDIIEVFRPMVDLCVSEMEESENDTLTVKDKQILFNLINCDLLYKKQKQNLSYTIEKVVQDVQASILSNKNQLNLCSIIKLQQHEYE